jgi:hypothetical protein
MKAYRTTAGMALFGDAVECGQARRDENLSRGMGRRFRAKLEMKAKSIARFLSIVDSFISYLSTVGRWDI